MRRVKTSRHPPPAEFVTGHGMCIRRLNGRLDSVRSLDHKELLEQVARLIWDGTRVQCI